MATALNIAAMNTIPIAVLTPKEIRIVFFALIKRVSFPYPAATG